MAKSTQKHELRVSKAPSTPSECLLKSGKYVIFKIICNKKSQGKNSGENVYFFYLVIRMEEVPYHYHHLHNQPQNDLSSVLL